MTILYDQILSKFFRNQIGTFYRCYRHYVDMDVFLKKNENYFDKIFAFLNNSNFLWVWLIENKHFILKLFLK